MIRVLVVDDNSGNRRALARVLASSGFDVSTASDAGRALTIADVAPPHVVLVVYELATNGAHLVRAMRERRGSDVFVVALHGRQTARAHNECHAAGADLVLETPRADELCRIITMAALNASTAPFVREPLAALA